MNQYCIACKRGIYLLSSIEFQLFIEKSKTSNMDCFSSSSSYASLPSFNGGVFKPSLKRNYSHQYSTLRVKAHCFRDDGRMNSMVDGNLSVLRERIEAVKMKERLESCCRREHGWNYSSAYSYDYDYKKSKTHNQFGEFLQLFGLVVATIGFTCISGTFFLCLVSLFVHLSQ